MSEKTCGTCKWWGHAMQRYQDYKTWRRCGSDKTFRRVKGPLMKCHKNFGCIHHQPRED